MKKNYIYVPKGDYKDVRYVLGEKGNNPVICIGINPSTATPEEPDNTIKSVKRIAKYNGYDGWIMLNVYPLRETDPKKLPKDFLEEKIEINKKEVEKIIKDYSDADIWCAWGTAIEKREYLKSALKEMLTILAKGNNNNFKCIACTKNGHPRHPLYAKTETKLQSFDIKNYLYIK